VFGDLDREKLEIEDLTGLRALGLQRLTALIAVGPQGMLGHMVRMLHAPERGTRMSGHSPYRALPGLA
jgi:hypothetical protein